MRKKGKNSGMVYSTNPDFEVDHEEEEIETLSPHFLAKFPFSFNRTTY